MQTRQLALKAYCPYKYKVEVKQSKAKEARLAILFHSILSICTTKSIAVLLRPTEQKESCAAQLLLLLLLLYAC